MSDTSPQKLLLKGKTAVFIDYANVYGWRDELVKPVDPNKLYKYLKTYSQIESINFYYGSDSNPQSKNFLTQIKKIGYNLTTKPVKYITIANIRGKLIKIRKCDFDIEICMSVYRSIEENYQTFVFFTGDGDFEPIYRYLIEKKKQVLVVYEHGHLGREIWNIKRGLFKTRFTFLQCQK
ncbi:MAG: NYN domain-containing protein [Candidatus Shapirobacteria bacterium]|jgi:uncharacterized LabA/DUF88 family protein